MTDIEKVTNLQVFISLEEIKLLMLLRNTNFISVRNPYISLLRISYRLSHITRKPSSGVCKQIILKPACSATETSFSLETLDLADRQRTTKALIRLRGRSSYFIKLFLDLYIDHEMS